MNFSSKSLFLMFLAAATSPLRADPLDETERNRFHLALIGAWDDLPGSLNNVAEYKSRMLVTNGGIEPKHLKVGMSNGLDTIMSTQDEYYDFIYSPARVIPLGTHRLGEIDYSMALASRTDVPMGFHVNGMPWADDPDQSVVNLHNFLEKYDNGSLLQVDRLGRIRRASLAQLPFENEVLPDAPQLEMQLTLSPNATFLRNYVARNNRSAMRQLWALREEHPDLVSFASMSSEVAQNIHANVEYCDYSIWSQMEFREWLSGTGRYAGRGQYLDLAAFNLTFVGASGFPKANWDAVSAPTSVNWGNSGNGRWWKKWHEFRIHQVQQMVQAQVRWSIEAGWSPDMLYSHQVPLDPASTSDNDRKFTTPWTTAFVDGGGNGITTYFDKTSNTTIFNAIRANDKNWGIFEYNPVNASSVPINLNALNSVWNTGAKALAPYLWWGIAPYEIKGTAFETALAQFVFERRDDVYNQLAPHEVSPTMRDVIWSMSESSHIESETFANNFTFNKGVASIPVTAAAETLSLKIAEPASSISGDSFQAASFRMFRNIASPGDGAVSWTTAQGSTHTVPFPTRVGWHVYRINLADHPGWREQEIHSIQLKPSSSTGGTFSLDWFRLEANFVWNFDSAAEIYGSNDLTSPNFVAGEFNSTTGADPHFYLATDRNTFSQDADRAFIDTKVYQKVRVKMTAAAAGNAQFFWWTRGQTIGQFSQISFPVNAGPGTYEIDLTNNPAWTGEVTRLRLDPIDQSGVAISIDRISLTPGMLAPRIANSDSIVNSPNPEFLWEGAIQPNHTGITYQMQLARDFEFTELIQTREGLTGNRCLYSGSSQLDGQYWWRVRARDGTGRLSPWAVPMPMFVRAWTMDRPLDTVKTTQLTPPNVSGGIWSSRTTGNDSQIILNTGAVSTTNPAVTLSRGINADVYKRFVVRARLNSNAPNNVAQLIFTNASGIVNWVFFTIPATNTWQDITVDLANTPTWWGYMKEIRLDLTSTPNIDVFMDHAYFMPVAEAPVANSAPSFTSGGNVAFLEDNGAVNLPTWATAINAGPGDGPQALTFLLTNDNPGIFSIPPAISPSGALTFTPAPNANGVATITVSLRDDGGTSNGGIDTSPVQNFTITITPANDPPVAGNDVLFAHANQLTTFPFSSLLANDTDIDGPLLSVTSVVTPSAAGAAVSQSEAGVSYLMPDDFTGADTFSYQLSDGAGGTATGNVAVTVVQPKLTSWSITESGFFNFNFTGIPLRSYEIQVSEDLETWSEISTLHTDSNGTLFWQDTESPDRRFYRLKW